MEPVVEENEVLSICKGRSTFRHIHIENIVRIVRSSTFHSQVRIVNPHPSLVFAPFPIEERKPSLVG